MTSVPTESDVPDWADEPVHLHPPDPAWAARAAAERARLTELLAPWLVDGVEHVGSTAVPGLPAKPIVDLAASVTDPDVVLADGLPALTAADWCLVPPELDQRPWRRFLVLPDPSGKHRVAHLHLIAAGHDRWHAQLRFRDALRADPDLARRYAALKHRLATAHPDDRETYTKAKTTFITTILNP